MRLAGWELNLETLDSIIIGVQRDIYEEEDVTEVDWSVVVLFVRLRLTLIYN